MTEPLIPDEAWKRQRTQDIGELENASPERWTAAILEANQRLNADYNALLVEISKLRSAEVDAVRPRAVRQENVSAWVRAAFGDEQAASIEQRGIRLLEEAIEAYQAAGGDRGMAHRLVDYVFGRPVGQLGQEIGGVGVTLLALASAAGLSADAEEAREVACVLAKPVEEFRQRNASKNAAGFRAGGTTRCGERDRDGDGNCDRHPESAPDFVHQISGRELDFLIEHFQGEEYRRSSGGGWKTLAALRELRSRRAVNAEQQAAIRDLQAKLAGNEVSIGAGGEAIDAPPAHIHIFVEGRCGCGVITCSRCGCVPLPLGKTIEALDVCEACERAVLVDVLDRRHGQLEAENHSRCEAAGLRVELTREREASARLRDQIDGARKAATDSVASSVSMLDQVASALDVDSRDECVSPAVVDIIAAARSAAWHSRILRSLVSDADLQALEGRIREGVIAAVPGVVPEAPAALDAAHDGGDLTSARRQLATCQDALRKLIARVERTGGYADHQDQQALIEARQASGEAG